MSEWQGHLLSCTGQLKREFDCFDCFCPPEHSNLSEPTLAQISPSIEIQWGGWYDDTGKFRWQSHTSKIVKDGYKALPLDIRYGMFGDKDYQTKPLHSGCENLLKMLGVCTLYILVQREWFWFREKWWGRDRINYASETLRHWVVKLKFKGKILYWPNYTVYIVRYIM